jgi:hypothetical protein
VRLHLHRWSGWTVVVEVIFTGGGDCEFVTVDERTCTKCGAVQQREEEM